MIEKLIYNQYSFFNENYFCFKGFFTEELIFEIGNLLKLNFSPYKNKQRIFAVFIEMTQNIAKYSDEKNENNIGKGIFFFKEKNDYCYLISGNKIKKEFCEKIENIIKEVNEIDRENLKEFYQQKIRKPYVENKIGANVGFIDMRRKTDEPLMYHFDYIDDEHVFFILTVKLKKEIKDENY